MAEPGESVRTKAERWHHPVVAAIEGDLAALRHRLITTAELQARLLARLDDVRLARSLAAEIAEAKATRADVILLRRHVGPCRYTLQIVHVADGEVHPPHHHHNLVSTQVVLDGRIHLREYERLQRRPDGALRLRLVTDRQLAQGEAFQASEWARNVHAFTAIGGPALIWNLNARGYESATFDPGETGEFGRRYLDVGGPIDAEGCLLAQPLDRETAHARYTADAFARLPTRAIADANVPTLRLL